MNVCYKFDKSVTKLVLFTLILVSFFGLSIVRFELAHYVFFPILLFFAYENRKKEVPAKKMINLYVLFVFISCVYSNFFNDQFFLKAFACSYNYLGVLFVYYLISSNFRYETMEKALFLLSLIYCVGYFIQWIIYPIPLFSAAELGGGVSEDIYRLRIGGSICASILFYYGINRFLIDGKLMCLIYSLLGFFPIIIMGFRSLTFLTVIGLFVMIFFVKRKMSSFFLSALFFGVIIILSLQTNIVSSKIEEMMQRQETNQTFDNEDYVRIIAYNYFTEKVFVHPYERFFGGGPTAGVTTYSRNLVDLAENYGFYWQDLGLIGLSWLIGVPSVVLLVCIYLRCAWCCRSPEIQFIRFTLLVVVIASIVTTMELFRQYNIILASYLLSMEHRFNLEHQNG